MPEAPPIRVEGGRFVVAYSGYADGPAQPLVRYLNERGARSVVVTCHPLSPETAGEHVVQRFERGRLVRRAVRTLPNKPPWTYAFDPFVHPALGRADAWFGFNCLATAEGLVRRRSGRVAAVFHWNVDFVPERFGTSPMTRAYEWLDALCCRRSDARVELSEAARAGRVAAYGLDPATDRVEIVPMGSWVEESPTTSERALEHPRIVFLGHLVERMGVGTFIDAMSLLAERRASIAADVVGGGPMLDDVRRMVADAGLQDRVTVHGFVADFEDVRRVLAGAAVAVAPYETDETSFSRFADPGKLKAYLAAGLPIVLTDVPPNAHELVELGGATLAPPTAAGFAEAIARLLDEPELWRRRHEAARRFARRFDWGTMLDDVLPRLGLEP